MDRDLEALKELVGDVEGFARIPTCAVCGATDRTMFKNFIAVPPNLDLQTVTVGIENGFYTICDVCAPPCRKCRLPRVSRKIRDFAEAVGGRLIPSETCQHFHLSSLWQR